jgi:hypothetical protein
MKIKAFFLIFILLAAMTAQAQELVATPEISFTYDEELATGTNIAEVEETPLGDDMPYWAATPAYTQVTFTDYLGGTEFFHQPRISVYRVGDLADYGDDLYSMYGQYENLAGILSGDVDMAEFATYSTDAETAALPFLPLFNAAQVFRAQPEMIEFDGGQGIRYLAYYSQSVNVILETEVFYTFQGLTDDGQFYISAIFPVRSGLFDEEYPTEDFDYDAFAQNYQSYMEAALDDLNNMEPDAFEPSLNTLDDIITSITVNE